MTRPRYNTGTGNLLPFIRLLHRNDKTISGTQLQPAVLLPKYQFGTRIPRLKFVKLIRRGICAEPPFILIPFPFRLGNK
jgi:hypothetical protein